MFRQEYQSRHVFEDNMVEAKAKTRGLRGQGQGHKILSSYGQIEPKSRPPIVEAKAKARDLRGQGQGHKILSSRSRPVLEDPIPVSKVSILQVNLY